MEDADAHEECRARRRTQKAECSKAVLYDTVIPYSGTQGARLDLLIEWTNHQNWRIL